MRDTPLRESESQVDQPALPSWRRRLAVSAIAFAAALIALGGIAFAIDRARHMPVTPPAPSAGILATVPAGARPLIVDPGWLVDRRADTVNPPLIIDLSARTRYETEHIPGAIHAWWQDGMELNTATYGRLVSNRTGAGARQRWLQSLGVAPGRIVVVYDDNGGRDAARLVWILGFSGVPGAVVLNGGLTAWKQFGLPVTATESHPPAIELLPLSEDRTWLISTDELQQRLGDPSLTIVDVRSEDERNDDLNSTIRTGRIPRSIALPWTSLMDPGRSRYLPPEEMAAVLASAGLDPADEIVLYGKFGIDTGRVWLALTAAGFANVRTYDVGWAFWASQPDLPVDPLPDDTVIFASAGSRRSA